MFKLLTRTVALAFLLPACATPEKPVSTHILSAPRTPEHDELIFSQGTIDYYPDKTNPNEIVMTGTQEGRFIDVKCLSTNCQNGQLTIQGSELMPDGDYLITSTDNPNIIIVRHDGGDQALGYLTTNRHSHAVKYVATIADANAWEHKGDTPRAVGKVALYTLLIGMIITAPVAADYLAAREDGQDGLIATACPNYGFAAPCTNR